MTFTFGIRVPAGVFVPSLVVGGMLGRAFGICMQLLQESYPKVFFALIILVCYFLFLSYTRSLCHAWDLCYGWSCIYAGWSHEDDGLACCDYV
jgi:hypothetical protein